MTKSQVIDCITVLQGGSNVDGKLCTIGGRKCAVGTLLQAVGYSNKEIRALGGNDVENLTDEMREKLFQRFGLDAADLDRLMEVNDKYGVGSEIDNVVIENEKQATIERRKALTTAVCNLSGINSKTKKGK